MEKKCTRCEKTQDVAHFHKHTKAKDGLQSLCKHCSNEASKWSQGMKRQNKKELADLLNEGELGYRIAMKELERKYLAAKEALAVKYHKGVADVAFNLEAKKGVEGVSVRSPESESVSDNG